MQKLIIFIISLFTIYSLPAQEQDKILGNEVVIQPIKIDSLSGNLGKSPLKASLYSAVLPGLGQLYNKRYIKAPIALGLVGTGVYFIQYYDKRYKKYHKAYLAELNGLSHEFSNIQGITPKILANAEDSERRNRDYAIVLTALAYLLNIVDAAVDAHLYIFKKDKDLAIKPVIIEEPDSVLYSQKLGVSFSLTF